MRRVIGRWFGKASGLALAGLWGALGLFGPALAQERTSGGIAGETHSSMGAPIPWGVGGGITIAPGLAMAIKHRRGDDVVACFFGDGASNEGAFHEKVTNTIADDIVKAIQPRKLVVEGDFFVRGGIGTLVTVTHEKQGKGAKPAAKKSAPARRK